MAESSTSKSSKREEGEGEQEEIKLPVPDFDPEAYMEEEIEKADLAVLNTGYGILLAGVAVVLQRVAGNDVLLGWATLLVGVGGLRAVYKLGGVGHHEWGAKEWLAAYVTLFFSFLAFWYLFQNPPF